MGKDNCPKCGDAIECATDMGTDGVSPKPDDISMCWRCGATLQFNENLKLQTVDETTLPDYVRKKLRRMRFVRVLMRTKQRMKNN
jgi:hypothetical protein